MTDAAREVAAAVDAWANRPASLLCCQDPYGDVASIVAAFVAVHGPETPVVRSIIAPSRGTRIERVALEALVAVVQDVARASVQDPPSSVDDLWNDVDRLLLPLTDPSDDGTPTQAVLLVLDDPGAIVDLDAPSWNATLAQALEASIHVLLVARTAEVPAGVVQGLPVARVSPSGAAPLPVATKGVDRGVLLRAALLSPVGAGELDALGLKGLAEGAAIPDAVDDVTWRTLATRHASRLREMEARVDALVLAPVAVFAEEARAAEETRSVGGARAPIHVPRYVVEAGGAHAARAGWPFERLAIFASHAWLARWRIERGWSLGFDADVWRARRAAEARVRDGARRMIVDVVGAAVIEGVARRLATSPDKLSPSRLALARAEGVTAIYRAAEGPVREKLRAMVAVQLAAVGADPACASARAELDEILVAADAAGAPIPLPSASASQAASLLASAPQEGPAWKSEPELAWRLRALERAPDEAHLRDALRVARQTPAFARSSAALAYPRVIAQQEELRAAILDGLHDVGAVEVRAALIPHAGPDVARRLAAEATALQLRGGDDDSFVNLVRRASALEVDDAVKLILENLGHAPVDKLLRPYGELWHVAPLLARVLSPDDLVAVAERVIARASIDPT